VIILNNKGKNNKVKTTNNITQISGKKAEKLDLKKIAKFNSSEFRRYREAKKMRKATADTTMRDKNNLVEFEDLNTWFYTDIGTVHAVDGVSFDIPRGKTIAVVGESGCGKSVTSLSLMGLVEGPVGQIVSGSMKFAKSEDGSATELTKLNEDAMRKFRGNEMAMIFQEPMTSLNPVFTIGKQIGEAIKIHSPDMSQSDIKKRTLEMLKLVSIARPEGIMKAFPHELSGGMRQRVMIAMALSCNPQLIIADEPTTALDVTIQAVILDLLRDLKLKIGASIMLITHDLGVVAEMADHVVVMYAGRIVEKGTAEDIYYHPAHPYTIGLLGSKPVVGQDIERLYTIPGNVPNPIYKPTHCFFKDRCEFSNDDCNGDYPAEKKLSETHSIWCYKDATKDKKMAKVVSDIEEMIGDK